MCYLCIKESYNKALRHLTRSEYTSNVESGKETGEPARKKRNTQPPVRFNEDQSDNESESEWEGEGADGN